MKVKVIETADGRRVVEVAFTPGAPDGDTQEDVVVVFEVQDVSAAHLDPCPYGMLLLACSRIDSREPYALTKEQRSEALQVAIIKVAEEDGLDSWLSE